MIGLSVLCLALVAALVYVVRQGAEERRELVQRIQAPEAAVNQFADRPEREPAVTVPVDDDQAFIEAKERRLNGSGG